jgi:hypothetical protein
VRRDWRGAGSGSRGEALTVCGWGRGRRAGKSEAGFAGGRQREQVEGGRLQKAATKMSSGRLKRCKLSGRLGGGGKQEEEEEVALLGMLGAGAGVPRRTAAAAAAAAASAAVNRTSSVVL